MSSLTQGTTHADVSADSQTQQLQPILSANHGSLGRAQITGQLVRTFDKAVLYMQLIHYAKE